MLDKSQTLATGKPEIQSVPPLAPSLVGVCASMKPAPEASTKSAAREFLTRALQEVRGEDHEVGMLCLRKNPLPFFDGRLPEELANQTVQSMLSTLQITPRLLLSIPCYWGGVSGVFKNFVDVLCGPLYDMPSGRKTVFEGKSVGIFVVGADKGSAERGAEQATHILSLTGARIVGTPVILGNPRTSGAPHSKTLEELTGLGRLLLSC